MRGIGTFTKLIAISTILLTSAALLGLWAAAGTSHAGEEEDAPVAFAISGLFGSGAFLGVELEEEIDHPEGGARITRVVDDSAAAAAGLEEGDIIVAFDGRTIRGPRALTNQMSDHEPGDDISITVLRDGRESTFDVELGERKGMSFAGLGDDLSVFAPRAGLFGCEEDDENCSHSFSWSCEGDDCEGFNFDFGNLFGRPMLGVQLSPITDELREHLGAGPGVGILVSKVVEGSAAEDAGISVGDLIVSVDGEDVAGAGDIREALEGKEGETFDVQVIRDGRSVTVDVTIPERDDDAPTGPRALHFAPHIELHRLGADIEDVMEHVRETLGQAHGAHARALHLEGNVARREAIREALEQSREVREDAMQRAREALEKSRAVRNMI